MAMASCCLECTPGNPCRGMLELFKRRPRALQQPGAGLLRRALARIKINSHRRRRRARSFSSVRAVFWPLMSMRSDADRTDAIFHRPPLNDAAAAAVLPQVLPLGAPAAPPHAASTTAARVLALQSRLGEAAAKPGGAAGGRSNPGDCGVEEACGSFEKHLVEMLVEERKVRDLMDVEELLCCWEKLRCPVFIELVGRFYGELCIDLFFGRDADESTESSQDITVLALA